MGDVEITVLIDPPGWRKPLPADAEEAVSAAAVLLERARAAGYSVPRASFYADGTLVRGSVTRTDLATRLGRCWCGRGNLYGRPRPGEAFCCAEHEALWRKMSDRQRARVIVARFLRIYGRKAEWDNLWAAAERRSRRATGRARSRTATSSASSSGSGRAPRGGRSSGVGTSSGRRSAGG